MLRTTRGTAVSRSCLRNLFLRTALQVFWIGIGPVATDGITVVWEDLTANPSEVLNEVWAKFLKRARGLSKHSSLETSCALTEFDSLYSNKMREIPWENGARDFRLERTAQEPPMFEDSGLAVHGFHNKL